MEPTEIQAAAGTSPRRGLHGGRFDFDDGGTYCGGWDDGKAHGHGVCTGPKGQGAYAGSWNYGFEVSGVYTWPSGSSFEGQWQNGKRHGLGVETRGRWLYRGEWTQGFKGRYGVRESTTSNAKYEGTWACGFQDGYGSESYADGGTYQGQWLRGMRHGYGVRASAPFGLASHYRGNQQRPNEAEDTRASNGSLSENGPGAEASDKRAARIDDARGGFVLKARSDEPPLRRNSLVEKTKKGLLSGLKMKKQKSTGELEKRGGGSGSIRSGGSGSSWFSSVESNHSGITNASHNTDSNASFIVEDEHLDASVTETYTGEWKNDKRTGFGVSERSDGLRYEGEWFANRKYGYGVTTFRDGTKEEGKYKNNVLITSEKRKHMFLMRSAKFRERIDAALHSAQRASKIALQKADIAISRASTARTKADQADLSADTAKEDCELAQMTAKQFAPDFKLPSMDKIRMRERYRPPLDDIQSGKSTLPNSEKAPDQASLSNHVLSNSQNARQPPGFPARRPSAAYPKTVQPYDDSMNSAGMQSSYTTTDNTRLNNYGIDPSVSPQSPQSNYLPEISNINRRMSRDQQLRDQNTNLNDARVNITPYSNNIPLDNMSLKAKQQMQNFNGPSLGTSNEQQFYRQSDLQHPTEYNNYGDNSQRDIMINQRQDPRRYNENNRSDAVDDRLKFESQQEATFPRRGSRQQAMQSSHRPSIDYFDHYQRPPSRESSVDKYGRRSRQPSQEARAPSLARSPTPMSNGQISNGAGVPPSAAPIGGYSRAGSREPAPFEESLMRQRTLGQEVSPSPYQPKRTESLFVPPKQLAAPVSGGGGGGARKLAAAAQPLQRKKSLPEVAGAVPVTPVMSREEVSALGSARREQVRRMAEESERLRANPLLYLVSPQVKNWFSRQQLVLVVLFVNISLGILFFKLLT